MTLTIGPTIIGGEKQMTADIQRGMLLTIGTTVIGGEPLEDDYVIRADGYGCGRIRLANGLGASKHWAWWINPPVPVVGKKTGQAASLEEACAQWKAAWALARPSLTDDDVRHWHELEDGVRARFGITSTG